MLRMNGFNASRHRLTRLSIVFLFGLLAACTTPVNDDQLYQQLGRVEGITRIIDNFLYYVGEDERIIDFFAETDIDQFRERFIEQICEVSGGPCEYTGDTMAESHRDMDISEAHFNATVEDLIKAMEDAEVPTVAQNRLLALLAPMHGDITGR